MRIFQYAKRASVAAAPLASWVQANVRYAKVLNKIKPLEQEQMKLQRYVIHLLIRPWVVAFMPLFFIL